MRARHAPSLASAAAAPEARLPPLLSDILFRSDALEARRVIAGDAPMRVVTFDSYHDAPGFDRPGFGELYLAAEGLGAIHLMSYDNDWFQHAETMSVLSSIRMTTRGAERLLAYGSSMGGYAAIRFADAIGADRVLALSPQYSVDPRKVRFERRWMQDQRRIRFRRALDGPIRSAARIVVAYDPEISADRAHVERIAADVRIERLPLPFAGHPVGAFLAETGLIKPLVEQVLAGTLDAAALAREAAARAQSSPTWLGERSAAEAPGAAAIALAERAVALAPRNPAILSRLGQRLAEAGAAERAVAVHAQAAALDPAPGYAWHLGRALSATGDLAGALAVAEGLQASAPSVAAYHRWAAELRLAAGDRRGALADLRAAVAHAPRNRGYRWDALRLGWSVLLDRRAGR